VDETSEESSREIVTVSNAQNICISGRAHVLRIVGGHHVEEDSVIEARAVFESYTIALPAAEEWNQILVCVNVDQGKSAILPTEGNSRVSNGAAGEDEVEAWAS
jgi:hypothetical protein